MKNKHISCGLLMVMCVGGLVSSNLAHAQTNVEVYGLVGLYIGSTQRSDTPMRTLQEGQGGLTASYIGFRGKEDLGDGWKTIFQLENFFQPDTGAAGRSTADPVAFSHSAWVGLEGSFGHVVAPRCCHFGSTATTRHCA